MNSERFNLREENGQVMLDFLMPETLRNIFKVTLYGRGAIFDMAEGNPAIIWNNLDDKQNLREYLVAPYQEHGVSVIDASKENSLPLRQTADGIFLSAASDACGSLRFADCVPVVIASDGKNPWLLALHSGFVGTIKNICGASLLDMSKKNDCAGPGSIYAWVGPSICSRCYTRKFKDPKTALAMRLFSNTSFFAEDGYVHFDLKGEIRGQLLTCGVRPENIYVTDFCTSCDNDKFYSYRARDDNNRNFLLAVPQTCHKT